MSVAALTWGWGDPGTVDLDEARRNSVVAMCIGAIAKAFPEGRPQVVRLQDDADPDPIPDHPLIDLLTRPNPHVSEYQLAYQLMVDLNTWGTAYWLKARNGDGQIVQLWPLHPPSVVIRDSDDPAIFIAGYRYTVNGERREYKPEDVVRFTIGADPENPRYGLSPLKHVLREVTTDREATKFQASVLKNFGMPGVVVSTKGILPGQAEAFKADWESRFSGDNRGRVAVIDGEQVSVDEVGWDPSKLQLDGAHRLPEERISGAFGVPAIVAGLGAGLDRATYANFREAREMFTEATMTGFWRLVADQINLQLLPDFSDDPALQFRYDLTDVRAFQEDENSKWERARGMLISGAFTVNDVRREIGKPEIEGGDVYLQQLSTIAVPVSEREAISAALLQAETGQSTETPKGRKDARTVAAQRLSQRLRLAQVQQLPTATRLVDRAFSAVADAVDSRLKDAAESLWPNGADEIIEQAILRIATTQGALVWEILGDAFGDGVRWNETDPRVVDMLREAGTRARGLSQTTLDSLRQTLADNADAPRADLRRAIRRTIEETYRGRAEAIARTELRMATNQAAAIRYQDAGVRMVDVVDGDDDEPCRSRNGQRVTIEQFQQWDADEHPRGTISAIPVLEEVT